VKAIVYTKYGPPDVLQLMEVAKPIPEGKQVLVKVHAASVNALDWRRFAMWPVVARMLEGGLSQPKDTSIGADLAGVVEAVGDSVTAFQPGDEVFGVCRGSFAEYALAGETKLVRKPANVSFEAAAAAPVAALTALLGLRDKGQIQPGQKVLIHGASGGVGIFAVQIAKSFGADVTAVCSTRNVDMARQLGADHVIDYTREDFTRNGQQYDLILAVNGYRPIWVYQRALRSNGIYIMAGGKVSQLFEGLLLGPLLSRFGTKALGFMGVATTRNEDLLVIKELLEAGKIVPVIDRTYPLGEAAAAIRYMMEEHARGKVVIVCG
jgi:NADPH:quinone reductase-like Zn-dependent oxidoreductase